MRSKRTLSDWLRDTHLGPSAAAHLARAVPKMGVRYPSVQTNTFIGPLPANANETVVLTTPPLTLPLDGATVLLLWMGSITAGTGTTSMFYRIRRGTTTGGVLVNVGQWVTTTVAANLLCMSGWYFDTPGGVAGQQYSLTVAQIAASGAGIWSDGALLAFAL